MYRGNPGSLGGTLAGVMGKRAGSRSGVGVPCSLLGSVLEEAARAGVS